MNLSDIYLRIRTRFFGKYVKKKMDLSDISIIAMNCIGGVMYHDAGQKFLTPTVNLFFLPGDFGKFACNPEYYLSLKPEITMGEEYPVGVLDDIKVYFMHYETCSEALEKWEERKQRINYEKIFIIMVDRDGFTDEDFELFRKIKYPKVLFTVQKKYKSEDTIYMPEYKKDGQVPDLIPGRYMYKGFKLIKKINKVYR